MERYVLCRPEGGLNDALCQIEACWTYAKSHQRTLVLDFSHNVFLQAFFELLQPCDPEIPVIYRPDFEFLRYLDGLTSFPPEIAGRLTDYEWVSGDKENPNSRIDIHSGVRIEFDLTESYDEAVLVHHKSGGGKASFRALGRLVPKPSTYKLFDPYLDLANKGFHVAHVRNSDYRTDYVRFLRRISKRATPGTPILVLSDSNEVLSFVERRGSGLEFLTLGHHGGHTGTPLHLDSKNLAKTEVVSRAQRLLVELWLVGWARRLYISFLKSRRLIPKPRLSGLSDLFAYAVTHRDELDFWIFPGGVKSRRGVSEVFVVASRLDMAISFAWQFARSSKKKISKLLRAIPIKSKVPPLPAK